jgi:hypothetical protein
MIDENGLAEAQNVLAWDGKFRVRPGWKKQWDSVGQRIMGIIQYDFSSSVTKRIVVGHSTGWACLTSATGAWIDITDTGVGGPLTGSVTSQQVFRIFNKGTPNVAYLIGCNGVDRPKSWDGNTSNNYINIVKATDATVYPPAATRCMAINANRLLIGYRDSAGSDLVQCSSSNDFTNGWGSYPGSGGTDPAVLTVALGETPGEIIGMQEMGSLQTAIYKRDAVYTCIAQSTAIPFRFELKRAGIAGPVSTNSIVPLPDGRHAFLAEDGSIMTFDGLSVAPLGGVGEWRKIQKAILDTIDWTKKGQAWGCYDQEQGMLWYVFPQSEGNECTGGIVIDMPSMSVWPIRWKRLTMSAGARIYSQLDTLIGDLGNTIGSYSNSIGSFTSESPLLAFGSSTGQCYKEDGVKDEWLVDGIFTRNSVAYDWDCDAVTAGAMRFDADTGYSGLLIEEGTTNLLDAANVATGTDTSSDATGFTKEVGTETISSSTDYSKQGSRSLKVITPGGAANEGINFAVTTIAGAAACLSFYVRGSGALTAAAEGSTVNFTATGAMQRIILPFTASGAAMAAHIYTTGTLATTFYIDAIQIEQKAYATAWHTTGTARNAEVVYVPKAGVFADAAGTVDGWAVVKRTPGTTAQVLLDGNGAANKNLLVQITTAGKLQVLYGTGAATVTITSSGAAKALGGLVYWAVTWGTGGVTLYDQGVSGGTDATAPGLTLGTNVYIGSLAAGTQQAGCQFLGLSVQSSELIASQVAARYAAMTTYRGAWEDSTTWSVKLDSSEVGDSLGSGVNQVTPSGGQEIEAFLETGLLDFGDASSFKTLIEMDHLFIPTTLTQEVDVRIGCSDYGEEAEADAKTPVTMDLVKAADPLHTGHRESARMFAFRLDLETEQHVEWLGSSAAIVTRGKR